MYVGNIQPNPKSEVQISKNSSYAHHFCAPIWVSGKVGIPSKNPDESSVAFVNKSSVEMYGGKQITGSLLQTIPVNEWLMRTPQ